MGIDVSVALGFARDNRRGVLVTIRRDGRPQLSNVAYAVGDDGVIRISVTGRTAKARNLRRDPRATLHVTTANFSSYAVIDGTVTLSPEASAPDDLAVDELVGVYRAVAGEHPDWDDYRRAMVRDARVVVRLQPDRAYGMVQGGS